MNYLAHIYLSGEDEDLKIGNFIADSVKGRKFIGVPPKIQNGIILHRAIDKYTDSHPVVKKSIHRLFPIYSHYSAVIIDILYDHFLAANWKDYSEIPLVDYVENFYQLLNLNFEVLPKRVKNFLPYMIEDNWLLNYATLEGIKKILFQMDQRTKNRSQMHLSIKEIQVFYSEFEEEFRLFFKDLQKFSAEQIANLTLNKE